MSADDVMTLECIGGREDGRLVKVARGQNVVLFPVKVTMRWGDDHYIGEAFRAVACPVRRRTTGELAVDTSRLL